MHSTIPRQTTPPWSHVAAFGTILAVTTILAYANSLHVPLLFDDEVSIRDNPSLRNLADLSSVLWPPAHVFTAGRPLLNLSFALNYACGGLHVEGYHVVNVAIHLLAGLTLMGIVRRTLVLPIFATRWQCIALPCAALAAALWLLHPLATASITYLSQRAESLMALFYLMTLYGFIRSAEDDSSRSWRWFSVVACLAGALIKEIIVTAPIVVLLYDRAFISASFGKALRKRPLYYAGVASSVAVVGVLMVVSHVGRRGVGTGHDVAVLTYALTEMRAIVTYAKLTLWPHPLVFDYGEKPFSMTRLGAGISALAIIGIVATIALVWRRSRTIAFPAVVFFVLLVPTSTVIPIALQPVAENRAYLPLAGAMSLVAFAAFALGAWTIRAVVIVALAFGVLTTLRNHSYRSARAIWTDTVAKVPNSARTHNNLGLAISRDPTHRYRAIQEFERAIQFKPSFPEAEYNLANVLRDVGRDADAVAHYEKAISLKPSYGAAHNNLALILAKHSDDVDAAMEHFEAALRIDGGNVEAMYSLANAEATKPEKWPQAIGHFRAVIAAKPGAPEPHNNLAIVLARSGDLEGAVQELKVSLQVQPNNPETKRNLAIIEAARAR